MVTQTLDEMAKEFEIAKEAYFGARKNEAKKIIRFLQDKWDNVKINNAEGEFIKFDEDEINAECIVISVNDEYYISLQSFDIDPDPKRPRNRHVLMDRIALYERTESPTVVKLLSREIDLPLDNEKMKEIFKLENTEFKLDDNSTWQVREDYYNKRSEQYECIKKILGKHGFDCSGSGKGVSTYKSGGKDYKTGMKNEYDNRNWFWVDAAKNMKKHLISFQSFTETAKRINNYKHFVDYFLEEMLLPIECITKPFVEFDEMGICKYENQEDKHPKNPVADMEKMEICLPLHERDIKVIIDHLNSN